MVYVSNESSGYLLETIASHSYTQISMRVYRYNFKQIYAKLIRIYVKKNQQHAIAIYSQ